MNWPHAARVSNQRIIIFVPTKQLRFVNTTLDPQKNSLSINKPSGTTNIRKKSIFAQVLAIVII